MFLRWTAPRRQTAGPRSLCSTGRDRGGRAASPRSSSRSWRSRSSAAALAEDDVLPDRAGALRAVRLQPHRHPRGAEAARGARARAGRAGPRDDGPAARRLEPPRPRRAPDRARVRPRPVAARRPDRRAPGARARDGPGRRRPPDATRTSPRSPRTSSRWRGPTTTTSASASYDQGVPRDRDEGVRERGRPDDRARHPPARRGRCRRWRRLRAAPRSNETVTGITGRSRGARRPRRELAGERIAAHIEFAWAERKRSATGRT